FSGKFILDINGNPVMIPNKNIDIIPAIGPQGHGQWKILTKDGLEYYFGTSAKETTTSFVQSGTYTGLTKSFVSTWYLERIVSILDNDEVLFNYATNLQIHNEHVTQTKYAYMGWSRTQACSASCSDYYDAGQFLGIDTSKVYNSTVNVDIINPLRISEIIGKRGYVKFIVASSRIDVSPSNLPLEKIQVFNRDNLLLKYFKLDYGYFNAGCEEKECKRLFLNSIGEYGSVGRTSLPSTKFTYNTDVNLPKYGSMEKDYWGYYNSNNYSHLLPSVFFEGKYYPGANRNIDLIKSQANILSAITYPSGVIVNYEFESNQYYDNQTLSNQYVGGLRIKRITQYTRGSKVPLRVSYIYNLGGTNQSSGQIAGISKYFKKLKIKESHVSGIVLFKSEYDYLTRFSNPLNDLGDVANNGICYSEVTAVKGYGLGSTKTFFNSYVEQPDSIVLKSGNSLITNAITNNNGYKLLNAPVTDMSYRRGLMKIQTQYDNAGRILKYDNNTFFFDTNPKSVIALKAIEFDDVKYIYGYFLRVNAAGDGYEQYIPPTIIVYDALFYKYNSSNVFIPQSNSISYEKTRYGNIIPVSSAVSYEYSLINLMPKRITSYDPTHGKKMIKLITYPFDYNLRADKSNPTMSSALQKLVNAGINTMPIEQITYIENTSTKQVTIVDHTKDRQIVTGIKCCQTVKTTGGQMVTLEGLCGTSVKSPSGNMVLVSNACGKYVKTVSGEQLFLKDRAGRFILNGQITSIDPVTIRPDGVYAFESSTPVQDSDFHLSNRTENGVSQFNVSSNLKNFNPDSRYKRKIRYESYDDDLNLTQVSREKDIPTAYLWGYNGTVTVKEGASGSSVVTKNTGNILPIAKVINATKDQVAHTSFEYLGGGTGNLTYPVGSRVWDPKSKTGSYIFSNGDIVSNALPSGNYKVSLWVKGNGSIEVTASNTTNNPSSSQLISGSDWQFVEVSVKSPGVVTIHIPTGISADEIRIAPVESMMTTYTYDPMKGKTSETNQMDITTYYEYDTFCRLKLVRDQDGNILKRYTYQYQRSLE
ncbi:MAG: hypothetical protein K2Q22_03725, partial [Cytophagales bacterium]|nr:hypothetical protein [Cytophagales bacterium]